MAKRGMFDYILLETTGLADPGNIAPAFWVDDGLGSDVFLDGIVTMVDAVNLLRSLEEPVGEEEVQEEDDEGHVHAGPMLSVAHLQISHADVVVVNKADLVTAEQLEKVVSRVRSINALAKIHVTTYGKVPELEGVVLDLHAYDDVGKEALQTFAEKGHSHLDPAIGTVGVTFPVLDEKRMASLDEWLRKVLWTSTLPGKEEERGAWEVHRSKGRIVGPGGIVKMLQGVREIFEMTDAVDGSPAEESEEQGRIVFIGRGLGGEKVAKAFQSSLDEALGLR